MTNNFTIQQILVGIAAATVLIGVVVIAINVSFRIHSSPVEAAPSMEINEGWTVNDDRQLKLHYDSEVIQQIMRETEDLAETQRKLKDVLGLPVSTPMMTPYSSKE